MQSAFPVENVFHVFTPEDIIIFPILLKAVIEFLLCETYFEMFETDELLALVRLQLLLSVQCLLLILFIIFFLCAAV